ncbi:hypothetical protein Tco_0694050 [Tanacetum coccineum]
MANNTTRPREAPVARRCSYKEFMSCQPINFKGSEGVVGLIRWFERTELVFSHNNYTEDYKVKFATRSGYQQKDRKPSQNDKTEHGMEKTVQNQGQSPKMPKSESILKNQQSNRSRN